jgi:hypothetical protein
MLAGDLSGGARAAVLAEGKRTYISLEEIVWSVGSTDSPDWGGEATGRIS